MSTSVIEAPQSALPGLMAKSTRSFIPDAWNVMVRELRPVVRDPFSVVFGLVQPLVFIALFGPLLVGLTAGPAALTLQWFVPGVLVMVALFTTGTTGANLQNEMLTGSHERTLVAPLSRQALLVGRALKEIVPLVAQALIISLVTLPFGFRPNAAGFVIGLAILAVFGVGFGALSYALALAVRKSEWMFWMVQQSVVFPLMILSGMLLPIEEGPRWLQVAADLNPLKYIVSAERALFAGDLANAAVWRGSAAAAFVAVLGLVLGTRGMRKSG